MPNSIFSSQIALIKAESLKFGIKHANLATSSTTLGCWYTAISNEKSSYDLKFSVFAFACLCCYQTVTLQTNGLFPGQITFQLKLLYSS